MNWAAAKPSMVFARSSRPAPAPIASSRSSKKARATSKRWSITWRRKPARGSEFSAQDFANLLHVVGIMSGHVSSQTPHRDAAALGMNSPMFQLFLREPVKKQQVRLPHQSE